MAKSSRKKLFPVIWILIPVRKKTGTGKTTSNQQAVGGPHHRRDQIMNNSVRRNNDQRRRNCNLLDILNSNKWIITWSN